MGSFQLPARALQLDLCSIPPCSLLLDKEGASLPIVCPGPLASRGRAWGRCLRPLLKAEELCQKQAAADETGLESATPQKVCFNPQM